MAGRHRHAEKSDTEPRGGALPRVCPRGCQVVRHPANCTQNTQIVSDVVRTQALKTVPPSRARQAGFFGTVTTTPIDGPRIPGPQDQRRLSPSMSPYRLSALGPTLPSPTSAEHGSYRRISCRQRRWCTTVEDDHPTSWRSPGRQGSYRG